MEDPYQRFLTSMSRATPHPIAGFQGFPHEHLAPVPAATIPIGGQPPSESSPPSSSGYQEGQIPGGSDGSSSKGRKKSATAIATGDIVKHRRTRSGCFTCRSRRVKCDEKRPTCERCSKGNRECVYPDPPSRKGSGASRTSRSKEADKSRSPPTAGSTENDSDNRSKLQTIPDQEEPGDKSQASSSHPSSNITATPPGISGVSGRHGSETPSQESRSSPSNSTAASSGFATVPYDPSDFPSPSAGTPDWTNLTPEYQRHLTWYCENITHWHYGLNHDNEDFFTVILPQAAVQNQALLNAVVGFAAYEATIENPDGKVEEFLPYYNNSVSLLLDFLRRKEKHNVYTLMTILQLAQIEEYLGDWVNILGHQKAAHEIFTKLFTPQNVMDTPVGRMCLNWYARFDGFMAFMGSFPHDLSKEYAQAANEYNRAQVAKHPGDVNFLIVDRYSQLRLVSWQLAVCYARRNRGQLSMAEYCQEHRRLTDALHEYKDNWHPALTDPNFLITDFGGQQPEPDSIVNPFEPGLLYDFPLFNTTVSAAEWHSLVIIHTMLSPNKPLEEMFTEIKEHALTIARYWDTVKYWPHTPKGVLLHLKAILSTAGMCLPKDKKYENWVRRNFLVCESTGAIRAESHRKKIAEAFNDPTLVHWWLPNDEGFTPVLRRLREFADERNAAASTVQQEAVREAKQLFSKFKEMSLEESTEDTP